MLRIKNVITIMLGLLAGYFCCEYSRAFAGDGGKVSPVGSSQPSRILLQSPKPPFPNWLKNNSRWPEAKYSVAVKIMVEKGKTVQVVPASGNSTVAKYFADWVQRNWVFDPRASGTLTFPVTFTIR
jgi:hypothetical protein